MLSVQMNRAEGGLNISADQPGLIRELRDALAKVRRDLSCIRKDPQLHPHAKRILEYWETESR